MPAPLVGDVGGDIGDDAELLAAARAGDSDAFRLLWQPVERRAFGVCFHLTANRPDALDALQETQLAAWKGMHRYEGRAPFAAWVLAIARNAALSVVRRRSSHDDLLFPEAAEPHAAESGFDETVAGLVDLRRALATLAPAHREALLLWAGGLTYEQTAAALEVPLNTVKVWIFRGRRSLRELLG
ncbi:DNA-directed RNA polymerase sigma-70 factor [Acrocarpospora pleiomorpha]|uniref:DNA-directed RNA polymerase sigma-70 factor n=1 Tax=Acrocarpospora pleiomorpha TaxID=90975 RepID=A0A5M3XL28_9ACTN|nr:RNA polymerase sigma factor [Acrocarpospora pleiomorpha]GES18818.1 DNA-directed RNA polymerase sigma-70 factor [Acrocarpospora pleiomorpha]